MSPKVKILAVDDERINLEILTEYLSPAGFDVVTATDGESALKLLDETPGIEAVVLDRTMPRLDGITVLKRMKQSPRYADLPVIMQSAAASGDHIKEGLNAGAYYYLTKPFDAAILPSIVHAAVRGAAEKRSLRSEVVQFKDSLDLIEYARFRFRTLEEARSLAIFLAYRYPKPDLVVTGLNELMINAIEHGNLGITYNEKTDLVLNDAWYDEVERRLNLAEHQGKYAKISLSMNDEEIIVRIEDQGAGFNWHDYLDLSPRRAKDPHGRGIATTRMLSFDSLEYLGNGNQVLCRVSLNAKNGIPSQATEKLSASSDQSAA